MLVPCSTQLDKEGNPTSTPEGQAGVLVVHKHHLLVRCSHRLNVPILLGLILSGVSIYWASPVYQHKPDPVSGNVDPLVDIGTWICAHVPAPHYYNSPPDWIYNHISLGPGMLPLALRLHWLCTHLFMLNGLVYVLGLVIGGGWRSLLPRRTDLRDAMKMHLAPSAFQHKIQPTQRVAYFSHSSRRASFPSPRAGQFTNRCSSIGWLGSSVVITKRAFGTSG
jgi:hypothetical protein